MERFNSLYDNIVATNTAAGILPICDKTNRMLIAFRSDKVNSPNLWCVFGGKRDGTEPHTGTAIREFYEETGIKLDKSNLKPFYVFNSNNSSFAYHTYICKVDSEVTPKLNWENEKFKWVTYEELVSLPNKHFGLVSLLVNCGPRLKAACNKYT